MVDQLISHSDQRPIALDAPARAGADRPWPPPLALRDGGKVGIAGVNMHPLIQTVRSTLPSSWRERVPRDGPVGGTLGERARAVAWRRGVWFLDWTYVAVPDPRCPGRVRYRAGREHVFSLEARELPVVFDSAAYRAFVTGTAPTYAHDVDVYCAAIEHVRPDAYAAPDVPHDRRRTCARLEEIMRVFPHHAAEGRLWPVYPLAALDTRPQAVPAALLPPLWRRLPSLGALIPLNRTQRPVPLATRETWARQAIAYAVAVAADPDFRALTRWGRLMIGGLSVSPLPHLARHVFGALLHALRPDCVYRLLGQASWPVTNGLGVLELLHAIWLDSTWWLLESTADRFAVLADGLLTMLHVGRGRDATGQPVAASFATRDELQRINLRALQAAVAGLWTFPAVLRDVNLAHPAEREAFKQTLLGQQLSLWA